MQALSASFPNSACCCLCFIAWSTASTNFCCFLKAHLGTKNMHTLVILGVAMKFLRSQKAFELQHTLQYEPNSSLDAAPDAFTVT